MSSKLTVLFYIILCLEVGIVLSLFPWLPQGTFGLSDWGNNYFLLYAANATGLQGLQRAVSSGWVRGAVTGLGLLNLAIAFWEISHFRQTVRALQGHLAHAAEGEDAHRTSRAAGRAVSHHERRDDAHDPS